MRKALLFSGVTLSALGLLSRKDQPAHAAAKPREETASAGKGLTKTFIWGNGHYQARPDALIQFKNFEPKLIKTFLGADKTNFKSILFGEHYAAGIDLNDNLHVWPKRVLLSYKDPEIDDHEQSDVFLLDKDKNTTEIAFTKGFIWALKKNGDVYQWPIEVKLDEFKDEVVEVRVTPTARHVKSLSNIVQLCGGEDHLAALDKNGQVFTMGDDTYGQCGIGSKNRSTAPPFTTSRIRKPEKVEGLPPVTKLVCGGNHTLVLTEEGSIFGWGSNSNMQLSHETEFSKVDNPLLAVYSPLKISKLLENNAVTDLAAGSEFSFFVTKRKNSEDTEVFACGHNLHGELGSGTLTHLSDMTKIEGLSNYRIKTEDGEKVVGISQISCGYNHCMALMSIGAILEWGANEFGQLGNKKRSFSEHPIVLNQFLKEKVLSVSCGANSSAVITENREEPKK